MKAVSPLIGAYWSARMYGKDAFADKALTLLKGIKHTIGRSVWYPLTSNARWRRPPMELNLASVDSLLRTNVWCPEAKPDTGPRYSLRLWNGNSHAPTTVAIDSGLPVAGQQGSVVIQLPIEVSPSDRTIHECEKYLRLTIESWDPDFAVATTMQALTRFAPITGKSVKGWFVYDKGDSLRRTPFIAI
jgi:hypothetical protein